MSYPVSCFDWISSVTKGLRLLFLEFSDPYVYTISSMVRCILTSFSTRDWIRVSTFWMTSLLNNGLSCLSNKVWKQPSNSLVDSINYVWINWSLVRRSVVTYMVSTSSPTGLTTRRHL
ncbi:hypothetical protein HanXRQr2_Chr14g0624941 [Helianthus annuus]|uniref:Uncharacterized protein n=1 Tax=Helianthus annuus TaxID=4232 RepID=A0A9K3E7K2_HELAN|nr:hypothetical protein HanXRQr2_Chr14g0624941 [Helianthus annuus]KAJ0838861.1 hypothetical protein HanPSC8_Chr14g0599721 [Helianthus annuus]